MVSERLAAGRGCSTKSLGSGTLGATTFDLTFFRASRAAASRNLASNAAWSATSDDLVLAIFSSPLMELREDADEDNAGVGGSVKNRVDDCDDDGDVEDSSLHGSKSCFDSWRVSVGSVRLPLNRSQTSSKSTVDDGVDVLAGASSKVCVLGWNVEVFSVVSIAGN